MTMPPPPGSWPPPGPSDPRQPSWDQLFAPDDGGWARPTPRPPSGGSNRPLLVGAAVVAVVAVVIGVIIVLVKPSSGGEGVEGTASAPPPTSSQVPSDADKRLLGLLPTGYVSGACKPVTPAPNATAAMTCTRNGDVGGPLTATYTLLPNRAALGKAFDAVVRASTIVECPGRIQSPGPWRRSAATPQVSGILFCGLAQNRPTVAWTDDGTLLLSSVQGDARGPNLTQLYTWWSSHS